MRLTNRSRLYMYNLITNFCMNKNQETRRNRRFTWLIGSGLLIAATLLTTSCAKDGYDDDERFDNGVSGQALTSPSAESITITPSADGKTQTISWPVVMGAGGYQFSFYDASNLNEPIVKDSLVDGCSVTVKREEDMNYRVDLKTLGNAKSSTSDASEATQLVFSTFTATYKTIPAGSDLNEWFAANPIPDDSIGVNLNYDLEAGGQYTVSRELDFDAHWVTLRSNSKSNPATIKYSSAESCINYAAPFNVKYLNFDCSGMVNNNGVFGFSKAPSELAVRDETSGFVIIEKPVTVVNCNFKNVNGYFFWDNRKGQKVAAKTYLVDNCIVQLTPPSVVKAAVIWYNNGGYINDLTISNSTFYNSDPVGDIYYFVQAGGYRAKDIGMATNSVNHMNSTFYRIGWMKDGGEWGNYNAMKGKAESYWTLTNCIFYACSNKGGVPRRFLAGSAYAAGSNNAIFANNTYIQADGSFDNVGNYDTSGTQIEEDPQFRDAENGDFHISGPTQVARQTGDPRWLP